MTTFERKTFPAPKPEPTPKKSGRGGKKTSTPMEPIVPKQPAVVNPEAVVAANVERSRINRNFGKNTERTIAKRVDGSRTPGSGAIKNSNRNLTGDVEVRDITNTRDIIKIEAKGCGTLNPRGEHSFTLNKKVIDQMHKEAHDAGEIGVLWLHWKGLTFEQDYGILENADLERLIALARIGYAHEQGWLPEQDGIAP